MALNKKLIHFHKKADFNTYLKNNLIPDTSIVFIKDTQEIWTHGTFYTLTEELRNNLNKLTTKVYDITTSDIDAEILLNEGLITGTYTCDTDLIILDLNNGYTVKLIMNGIESSPLVSSGLDANGSTVYTGECAIYNVGTYPNFHAVYKILFNRNTQKVIAYYLPTLVSTSNNAGLMSTSDKEKLDSITPLKVFFVNHDTDNTELLNFYRNNTDAATKCLILYALSGSNRVSIVLLLSYFVNDSEGGRIEVCHLETGPDTEEVSIRRGTIYSNRISWRNGNIPGQYIKSGSITSTQLSTTVKKLLVEWEERN